MKSAQALQVFLTIFLSVIAQCTISTAQAVVTQTGKETIESYDSATERLTISVEYNYQWQVGPDRFFTVEPNLIGNPSFSWTGTGACTSTPKNRTIRCPRGITSFHISYRYQLQINIGQGEFTYLSRFQRQFVPTNATYDLFYPSSWNVIRVSPEPTVDNKLDHFRWVQPNTNSFVAQVRFLMWEDLNSLQAYYESKKGTNEAAFVHQFLCIATRSLEEYKQNGPNGWANGFVKSLFDYLIGSDGLTESVQTDCQPWISNGSCFAEMGGVHRNELLAGFQEYCENNQTGIDYERWDTDHNAFLENAVKPCFDEVGKSGELSSLDVLFYKEEIPALARLLRETIQAACSAPAKALVISQFAMSVGGAQAAPLLPAPLTKDQLYNEALANEGTLSVTAENGSFFEPVGRLVR
jgi:hypothetical protein